MSAEENKQLDLHWRKEAYEKKNLNVIYELHAPDYVGHCPGPVRGREALKQLFAFYFAAFRYPCHIEILIAEGDLVVSRDTYRLKHMGEFEGIPPKGKELTITGTDIYRIVDGRSSNSGSRLIWVGCNKCGSPDQQ